jgi:hypothetical protein
MHGNRQTPLCFGVFALGLGLSLGLGAVHVDARAAEDDTQEAQRKNLALVKIEIKQPSGKVVGNQGDLVEWNEPANVVIDAEERRHAVSLEVAREDERASKIKVTMGYDLDGQPVVAPYSFDTRVKKREVIRVEGGLAIAITVTPKTVKVDPPKKKREKIKGVNDPKDPLDGLD